MTDEPKACPGCASESIYEEGRGGAAAVWVCAECAHEWMMGASEEALEPEAGAKKEAVKDAFGNPLADGDSVKFERRYSI